MLNWRRDPDYEMRMTAKLIEIEQIKKETEQLMRENKRLHEIESRLDALLLSADSCSSTPPETDCN
jgi:regulator of replication initiation timing